MKIVSLIPSATEIISALDLCDNLVGISHECDYPKEILKLPKLTTSRIKTDQLEVFNFCTECGFKNENKFQFCPSCGSKLTK